MYNFLSLVSFLCLLSLRSLLHGERFNSEDRINADSCTFLPKPFSYLLVVVCHGLLSRSVPIGLAGPFPLCLSLSKIRLHEGQPQFGRRGD